MAKTMGVTCRKREESMVSKLINLEERDTEVVQKMGNKEDVP